MIHKKLTGGIGLTSRVIILIKCGNTTDDRIGFVINHQSMSALYLPQLLKINFKHNNMDRYEIESMINSKADKWELASLTNEVSQLKRDLIDAEKQIAHLNAINSNRYTVLEQLLTLFAEHPSFTEESSEFYNLRGQL